ncbi:hypothetical protein VYU27_003455 [Nannochloropsis oceanica]
MTRRLSITDTQVWDRFERCYEEAITIQGRHSSLAEFLVRQPAEEVTAFFTDIVELLERRGIENYHLVLKTVEASVSPRELHRQPQRKEQRREDSHRSSTISSINSHTGGHGGVRDQREEHRGRGRRRYNDTRDGSGGGRHHRHHFEDRGDKDDYYRRRLRDAKWENNRRRRREEEEECERREQDGGQGRQRRCSRSRSRSGGASRDRRGKRGGRESGGCGKARRGRGGKSSISRRGKMQGRSRSRSSSSRSSFSSYSSPSSSSPPRPRPLASPASTSGAADKTQWSVVIYHGGEARKDFSGPLAASSCMSCDLDTSMQMGLTGDGDGGLPAEASLIYEDAHMRYWHDAKGRPLFVVTPQRHVHNLKELTAAEMHRLWSGAVQILTDMGCDPKEDMRDMILNAGLDRNHAHLHLKVRVTGRGFDRARAKWSQRRNRLVDALKAFARKQDC